jgi:peptidoglycan/LPS O-acetylase OafA/YrhL
MDARLSNKIRIVSFLLMVLVAYIHGYNENLRFADKGLALPAAWLSFTERFISDGVCRIAVPLFFAISGFLACESLGKKFSFQGYGLLLRKRISSLLIPYLLVSAAGIGLVVLLQLFPFSRPFFNNYSLAGSSLKQWLNVLFLSPVAFPLWFIRFLMNYFLIFPLLYLGIRYFREAFVLLLLLMWAYTPLYQKIGLLKISFSLLTFLFCFLSGTDPTPYLSAHKNELEGLFFFALGMYASLHQLPLVGVWSRKWLMAAFLAWIAWIAYRTAISLDIPARHNEVHYHLIGFTLAGTLLLWYFYDLFAEKLMSVSWLQRNAGFAIGVFLFHEPLLTIIKKGMIRILGYGDFTLLLSFLLAPPAAFLLSLWFSKWLSGRVPALYDLFTGSRRPKPEGAAS